MRKMPFGVLTLVLLNKLLVVVVTSGVAAAAVVVVSMDAPQQEAQQQIQQEKINQQQIQHHIQEEGLQQEEIQRQDETEQQEIHAEIRHEQEDKGRGREGEGNEEHVLGRDEGKELEREEGNMMMMMMARKREEEEEEEEEEEGQRLMRKPRRAAGVVWEGEAEVVLSQRPQRMRRDELVDMRTNLIRVNEEEGDHHDEGRRAGDEEDLEVYNMIREEMEYRGRRKEVLVEETEREIRRGGGGGGGIEGEGRGCAANHSCHLMEETWAREGSVAASLTDLAVSVRKLLRRTAASAPCPYPFTRVVGECYYLHRKKLGWERARRVCRGMGGDLAAPTHPHALQAHLADKYGPGYYWVGGRKVTQQQQQQTRDGDDDDLAGGDGGGEVEAEEGGTWLWLTGRLLDPKDWLFSRPDNQEGDEDCLEMVMSDYPGLFNDETCVVRQKFICQYWEG